MLLLTSALIHGLHLLVLAFNAHSMQGAGAAGQGVPGNQPQLKGTVPSYHHCTCCFMLPMASADNGTNV